MSDKNKVMNLDDFRKIKESTRESEEQVSNPTLKSLTLVASFIDHMDSIYGLDEDFPYDRKNQILFLELTIAIEQIILSLEGHEFTVMDDTDDPRTLQDSQDMLEYLFELSKTME